jgi:xanthine dehydrogenase small subunit
MASASGQFEFFLNGGPVKPADQAPQTTLLDYIRSCGFTGAKEGCAEGECGACAVLLVKETPSGSCYQAVNSCLIPLPSIAGQEVYTVEALAESGRLAQAQREMAEHGGSQCGYCTPGFVVSMFALNMRPPAPLDSDLLGGNLCRCTGYRPILDALRAMGAPEDTPLRRRLEKPAPVLEPFEAEGPLGRFSRPCNLADALRLAAGDSKARFVAGNTDLGVMTNLRYQRFPHLISLEGIAELREFAQMGSAIEIGGALTLTEIDERWTSAPTVFREWLRLFASPLIRNRATLGGNLATASPIGDSAPLLMALDAELRLVSDGAERMVPLHEFFRAYRETVLRPGEIIRSVRIPRPLPERIAFYKVAKRRLDDISTVAAAFSTRNGSTRLAFGGVGPVPLRATGAEELLARTGDVERTADELARTLRPISDQRGSAGYRLAMAQNLLQKYVMGEAA